MNLIEAHAQFERVSDFDVAQISPTARWKFETPGERLFLIVYDFVAANVPQLFVNEGWVVTPTGMTEWCRLIAAMELTHRCLNESVEVLSANEGATLEPLLHRLRLIVGLHGRPEITRQIAQAARLAALTYLQDGLSDGRVNETYREGIVNCCWCGKKTSHAKRAPRHKKATIEHLWPEYLGGSSDIENLTIACANCNSKRQHAFTWAWFSMQSFNEKMDKHGSLPLETMLALGLHRLIKVASGQTPLSSVPLSLKEASRLLNGAIPSVQLMAGKRYTFFELLNEALE